MTRDDAPPPAPPSDPEDIVTLQALRALDAPDPEALRDLVRTADATDDAPLRDYTELFGLLAYQVEPGPAGSSLKRRILTALAGDETQRVDPGSISSAIAPEPTPKAPAPPPEPDSSPGARLAWSLAAIFAFLAVGLGAGFLWISHELDVHRERLAAQDRALQELDRDLAAARAEQVEALAAGSEDLESVRERFRLVTARGTEICPLLPPDRSPEPDARAVLYIAADHQHWYLKANGLEPPDPPRAYRLWFVVGPNGEPVDAGTFRVSESGEVEMASPTMPEGTTAAMITLEPPGDRDLPAGPVVLYGDEVMRVL